MKLLVDQNLSFRLIELLADDFPGSVHVREFGLERATDEVIWEFAKRESYVIVSKDEDFHQRSFLYGAPPKVVWLRLGNCTTEQALRTLLQSAELLLVFEADEHAAFLMLP